MKKIVKVVLNFGLFTSTIFGIWHFFVPYIYHWYDYIPNAPREIIVSIDWINFFFSLFLAGSSFLLIIHQREIELKKGIFSFFIFLVFIWFSRVIITLVHPWNQPYQFIDIIQFIIFLFVFILLFIPLMYYLLNKKLKEPCQSHNSA
jgi:hypothetical protein